jgi:uncharacterized membrane protein
MGEVLLPIAVLGNGLAAGGSVLSVLGGAPLMQSLPAGGYVHVHQFLERRMHPFMPACLLVALVADVASAFFFAGTVRVLLAGAAVLLAGAVGVSVAKNVPINKWVATLDPADPPADFARIDPRLRWATWNRVRSVLMVSALVLDVLAVGTLLPGS